MKYGREAGGHSLGSFERQRGSSARALRGVASRTDTRSAGATRERAMVHLDDGLLRARPRNAATRRPIRATRSLVGPCAQRHSRGNLLRARVRRPCSRRARLGRDDRGEARHPRALERCVPAKHGTPSKAQGLGHALRRDARMRMWLLGQEPRVRRSRILRERIAARSSGRGLVRHLHVRAPAPW